jgi:hypothetical protein
MFEIIVIQNRYNNDSMLKANKSKEEKRKLGTNIKSYIRKDILECQNMYKFIQKQLNTGV